MRETLYIRLGPTPDADVEFGLAGADLRTLRVQRGPLAAAAALAGPHRVVVFVPGADVRMTHVRLPVRQPARLLQAVPFALEDQVAEDVEHLHFAIGPRQADDSTPVAVVSHARMRDWTERLRAQQLRPEWLVPEPLALPVDATGAWHALVDGAEVQVRHLPWAAFTCAVEELARRLTLLDPERQHPLRLHVPGESAHDWTHLDHPLQLLPDTAALAVLAKGFAPAQALNLLQGSYAQGRDLQRLWQPWKLAASLLLAWLLVAVTGYAVETIRLGAELEQQQQANLQRFQQLFPDEVRVVNLQVQLDQQLRRLAGAGGAGGPFPLLEALAQTLAGQNGLRLTGLQFRENALFLSLTAPDLQALEALRNGFAARRGVRLEVQSANAEPGGVQIRARLFPA